MKRALTVAWLTLCAVIALDHAGGGAQAAETSPRPIMLVVPTAAGGAPDVVARVLAANMAPRLNATIVVVNRSGASGTIAARAVAQANPDGHTLLLGVAANLAIAPNSLAAGYDPTRSFAPVGLIQRGPYAVFTHPGLAINSFGEFLDHARRQRGRLHFATPGVASAHHLAWELLLARTGISLVHVPFQAGPQIISETVAGRTEVVMTSPSSTVRQFADSGKLKVIATSGATRLDQFAQVPTIAEQGVPGYAAYSWWGVVAPSGTPAATIARLNGVLNNALDLPEIRVRLRAEGVPDERFATTPEAFGAWIAGEYAMAGKIIRERNIKLE
jgi:tripartite-type tricarboxylate transporter receptor subunit TctC